MSFKIFDSVIYGYGEPLVPFTLIKECNTLNEVNQFISKSDPEITYFVFDEKMKELFNTSQKIFESPDNGKTIYERNILQMNRTLIKSNKKALITGINGQDGSYLAELLLEKGYEVYGTLKRNSVAENQTFRLDPVFGKVKLEYADLTDMASLIRVITKIMPDEIYNLAAQSHVGISFDQPVYTAQATGVGALNLLEVARLIKPDTKIYQASSSEMFGNTIDEDGYQRETTQLNPVSPYGCAKVYAYNISRNYRHSYGMFISNGILFNHESPRRGTNFVTNKVVKEAVKIKLGLSSELRLGNLQATRDWGHAKDYVRAMWEILQLDTPGDYVCATGISHSVAELCDYVFSSLGMDYKEYVTVDEKYLRPEELHNLKGDSSKLVKTTNWQHEYTFETMLDEMIEYWVDYYKKK